jgi:hypothetical protein
MTEVKHQPSPAQHLEAAAHSPRGPSTQWLAESALMVSRQAHVPHGQKLYAVEHQAHPVQHQALPLLSQHQE